MIFTSQGRFFDIFAKKSQIFKKNRNSKNKKKSQKLVFSKNNKQNLSFHLEFDVEEVSRVIASFICFKNEFQYFLRFRIFEKISIFRTKISKISIWKKLNILISGGRKLFSIPEKLV